MSWPFNNQNVNICTYCTAEFVHERSKLLSKNFDQLRAAGIERIIHEASEDKKDCVQFLIDGKLYNVCAKHVKQMLELMDAHVANLP